MKTPQSTSKSKSVMYQRGADFMHGENASRKGKERFLVARGSGVEADPAHVVGEFETGSRGQHVTQVRVHLKKKKKEEDK